MACHALSTSTQRSSSNRSHASTRPRSRPADSISDTGTQNETIPIGATLATVRAAVSEPRPEGGEQVG